MPKAYDAFISYSHAADARLATALEHGLERLARPWNKLRAISVFRDETDLTLNPDLWGMIRSRLDRTAYLVLLMCPESAASPWVNKEVAHWCDTHGVDHVLMVWTGGNLEWDDGRGDFSRESSAVADVLRGRFAREPLYLDLRWARDAPDLSLASTTFRTAVAHVAAPIREMAPGDLEGEDVRLRRKAKRLARAAVTAVVVLAIAATIAAALAVRNARAADARAREATARQVGLAALDLPASEIDRALLMALVSADLADHDDPNRFQAAQVLIGRYSRLESLLHLGESDDLVNVRDVDFAPDGSVVAIAGRSDGSTARATWRHGDAVADVEPLPPGTVAAAEPGLAALTGSLVAIDPSGALAWTRSSTGDLGLIRVRDGAQLVGVPATAGNTAGSVVDVRGDVAVAAVGDRLTVYDTTGATGAAAGGVPAPAAVGVSADGASVLTAAIDGSLQRWTRSGDALNADQTIASASIGLPQRIVISRDGSRALVVESGGTALVDLGTGESEISPGGGTTVVVPDPSGRYVAVGGSRLSIWDLDQGDRIVAVPQVAASLDWSGPCDRAPACKLVAGGVAIDVFDPATETQVRLVDEIGAQSVAISPDGNRVVSGGWGESVAVWSVGPSFDDSARRAIDSQQLRATPSLAALASLTNTSCTGTVAVSPDGAYVVARDSGVTRLCTTKNGGSQVAVAQLNPGAGDVTALAVDDDGTVALGRSSGIVEVYPVTDDAFGRGRAIDVRVGGEQVSVDALAMRGGVVVAGLGFHDGGTTQARVVVWSLARMEPTSFAIDQQDVAAVAFLDDAASAIVVASDDDPVGPVTVQLWDTASRRRVGRALSGLTGGLTALVGADTSVVAADSHGQMYRWEIERDPTRDICTMSGRPLAPAEWDSFAAGALGRYNFDDPCD
jgi:WD40 repeat protein